MRVSDEIMAAACNRFVPTETLLNWLIETILPAVQILEAERADLSKALTLAGDAIYELELEANGLSGRRGKDPRPRSIPEYWLEKARETV